MFKDRHEECFDELRSPTRSSCFETAEQKQNGVKLFFELKKIISLTSTNAFSAIPMTKLGLKNANFSIIDIKRGRDLKGSGILN